MYDTPERAGTLINSDAARETARREIESGPQQGDAAFDSWEDAVPGQPQIVHSLAGVPDYWLVPIQSGDTTVGAVRVLGHGEAAASIAFRAGSNVLAFDPAGIVSRVEPFLAKNDGERAGVVLLVHDGPPGREAWRVEVLRGDKAARWIFVTPGGIYERPAGSISDDSLDIE